LVVLAGKSIAYATIRMLKRGLFGVVWAETRISGMMGQKREMPTRNLFPSAKAVVGATGFEPAIPCSQSRCANVPTMTYPVSGSVSGEMTLFYLSSTSAEPS
ncbi:MAG: hypothetical protein V3W14_01235, partial [Candidatus Neomarinimicrobiota bacterium]